MRFLVIMIFGTCFFFFSCDSSTSSEPNGRFSFSEKIVLNDIVNPSNCRVDGKIYVAGNSRVSEANPILYNYDSDTEILESKEILLEDSIDHLFGISYLEVFGNNNYLVVSRGRNSNTLSALDSNLTASWSRGIPMDAKLIDIDSRGDIVVGYRSYDEVGLLKLNLDGETIWEKKFKHSNGDDFPVNRLDDLKVGKDDEIVFSYFTTINSSLVVMVVDKSGDLIYSVDDFIYSYSETKIAINNSDCEYQYNIYGITKGLDYEFDLFYYKLRVNNPIIKGIVKKDISYTTPTDLYLYDDMGYFYLTPYEIVLINNSNEIVWDCDLGSSSSYHQTIDRVDSKSFVISGVNDNLEPYITILTDNF